MKKRIPSLVIERASDSGSLYYLSVLEYRKENYLVVVDNITEDEVTAFVIEKAPQAGIPVSELMSAVTYWFYHAADRYPLSFEFSRMGISHLTNRIHRTFELAHVTRLIGKDFVFKLDEVPKVRRRRVNRIPAGVEIKLKRSAQPVQLLEGAEKPPLEVFIEAD